MTLLCFLVVLSLQLDHGLQWDPANKCFTEVNKKKILTNKEINKMMEK